MIEVVAALFVRQKGDRHEFMACRRPLNKARGGLWEFVGGKVESGETHAEALIREVREELAIGIAVGDLFCTLEHAYPDVTVRLSLYYAEILDGEPILREHSDLRWLTSAEIDDYAFCPADKDILTLLKQTL